jgi:DNA-damage-inducible protein D
VSGDDTESTHHVTFESLRHVDESGVEYWLARELQPALEYDEWRNFKRVIEKAMVAADQSKTPVRDHFVEVNNLVTTGLGVEREIEDFELSRYACYLTVQNGDSAKPVIANGQTYFAIQTRRAELADDEQFRQLTEDQKRLFLRSEVREHNKQLVETAQRAGVESPLDFAIFQDHGYRGLYGGLGARQIHERKGLEKPREARPQRQGARARSRAAGRGRPVKCRDVKRKPATAYLRSRSS